jgi:hypothetical protein
MKRRAPLTCALLLVLCGAGLLLISCASTRGSTLAAVTATENATQSPQNATTKPAQKPPQSTSTVKKGLEIVTDPDYVEVWVDGAFKGLTPYAFEDISLGWHTITLKKDGYYVSTARLEFTGDYMLFQTTLVQIKGFLQISVTPAEALVFLGGERFAAGLISLPIGSYALTVRAFGYTEYRASVAIFENSITAVSVVLAEAPFAVTAFSLPKQSVNPENPGVLATLEGSFSVTGPGGGELRILDPDGREVFNRVLPPFTTWDQAFSWNARGTSGQSLPDGAYTLVLAARAPGSEEWITRESPIRIDRTQKIAPRSLWSGSSGLLYAPVSEVLPPGDFQVSVLGAGINDGIRFRAPVELSARIGLAGAMEVDVAAGILATSAAASTDTHILLNAAMRWNLLTPKGELGTGAALQVKIAAQLTPGADGVTPLMTDTLANFTGLSVEAPLQVDLGPVSLLLGAGVTGSFWYPYSLNTDGTPVQGFVAWMYLRAGVMLDLGSVMVGVSASTKTEQLPGGLALLATPVPFAAGAEIHWLIPGTRLLLSGMVAGEYQNEDNNYFMGGGGLGFLY